MTEENQRSDDTQNSPALGEWTRRGLMGTAALAGLSGIAAADQHNKGGAVYNWQQDVDANGHNLANLGALNMAATDHAISQFDGENLAVEEGVLHVVDRAVDVTEYGAEGDGETDDTLAIRDALRTVENDPSLDTVFFPDGTYIVDTHNHPRDETFPHTGLTIGADNMRLRLTPGATIKAAPVERGEHEDRLSGADNPEETDGDYRLIGVYGRDNVEIIGGSIDGGRDDHGDLVHQAGHGHCIAIFGATNVTIRDVTCQNAWGDGIYLHRARRNLQLNDNKVGDPEELWKRIAGEDRYQETTENVVIENYHADYNRRQGISVVSVDGLWLLNSRLENTQGTPPGAGIDIENHGGTCDRIFIDNLATVNNSGSAIQVLLDSPSPPGTRIGITNHHDVGSENGIQMSFWKGWAESPTPLNVQISNCVWEDVGFVAFAVSRAPPADANGRYSIVATDCTAVDPAAAGYSLNANPDTDDVPNGNMELNRPSQVVTEGDLPGLGFYIDGDENGLENVVVRNPRWIAAETPVLTVGELEEENLYLIDDRQSSMSTDDFNARF